MPITTFQRRVIPKLVPITPMELYIQQVKSVYDSIGYTARGFSYTPAQMGGLFGQLAVFQDTAVLQLTNFEVPGG